MSAPTGTELDRLAGWCTARLPGAGPVRIGPLAQTAGRTHEVHLVTRAAGRRWVLRIAPPGAHGERAFDLSREATVLDALAGTGIPHAEPVLRRDDSAPTDRDFLVQRYVDGVTLDGPVPAAYADAAGGRALADAIVDTLAGIAAVDRAATGLAAIGNPAGYLDRQFDKAQRMLARARGRATPRLDALLDTLARHRPADPPAGLMHGDYSTLNLRAAADRPRIVAVFDWETATVGDPLIDLGYLTARWVRPAENPVLAAFTLRGDLPDAAYLTRRYAARTGRSLDDLPFYRGLAMARLAVALECRGEPFAPLADAVTEHGHRAVHQ